MTMESMAALILKRAKDATKVIDVNSLRDNGYNLREILDYMYAVTMIQVKKDIIPITIAETAAETGDSIEHITGLMKKYLMEKQNENRK